MKKKIEKECGNCVHYCPNQEIEYRRYDGTCRHDPPVVLVLNLTGEIVTRYPERSAENRACGKMSTSYSAYEKAGI